MYKLVIESLIRIVTVKLGYFTGGHFFSVKSGFQVNSSFVERKVVSLKKWRNQLFTFSVSRRSPLRWRAVTNSYSAFIITVVTTGEPIHTRTQGWAEISGKLGCGTGVEVKTDCYRLMYSLCMWENESHSD